MSAFRKAAYKLPVGQESVASDFPGFSFGVFYDPPGQVWADFTHSTDEFVVVAEGEVEIDVAGESATCLSGDLVLIPAGAVRTLRTTQQGPSTWFYGYGRFGDTNG